MEPLPLRLLELISNGNPRLVSSERPLNITGSRENSFQCTLGGVKFRHSLRLFTHQSTKRITFYYSELRREFKVLQ